jgi:hypothetical protein
MMWAEGKRQVGFLRKWDRHVRKYGKEASLNGLRLPVHCSLATIIIGLEMALPIASLRGV